MVDPVVRQPCWLCDGLGAIAVHRAASDQVGKTLWVAHRPRSASHPVRRCPACSLVLVMAEFDEARALMAKMAAMIPDHM